MRYGCDVPDALVTPVTLSKLLSSSTITSDAVAQISDTSSSTRVGNFMLNQLALDQSKRARVR